MWWLQWMYRGVPGPPEFLQPFLLTDGDRSYDRVGLEMFIVVMVLALAAVTVIRILKRKGTFRFLF